MNPVRWSAEFTRFIFARIIIFPFFLSFMNDECIDVCACYDFGEANCVHMFILSPCECLCVSECRTNGKI